MDLPQKKSYKMRWIAGASIVVLLAILGGTFFLVSQTAKNNSNQASSSKTSKKVATKQDLQNDVTKLAADMKKATSDQTALETAIKNPPKKVSQ